MSDVEPRTKSPIASPRYMDNKATIKRNSDTWDRESFNTINRRNTAADIWARLVATHPSYPNVDIVKDEVFFGRRDDADVVVRDGAISSTHCRLWREKTNVDEDDTHSIGNVFLEDLSTNGTFIKDQRIGKGNTVPISSGTEITLIPRGANRPKVSYIIYIPSHEEQEEAPEGRVTFVFTDVQSSTSLWEKCPIEMNEALKKHDAILRRLLRKHRGYEVKTEGDAFMVAFFTVLDAILWCIAVQKALLVTEWPEELLLQPAAGYDVDNSGNKIWNGIRIRMGVHTGKPNCRRNPVTGRMDYFGPTVNRAARVSDSAHGGQVVMTEEVKAYYDKAKTKPDFPQLFPEAIEIAELGLHSYKGIPELVKVYQVYPPELANRKFPPLRTEQSKGRKKSMQGHKLLAEEKKDYMPSVLSVDEAPEQDEPVEETYPCANPECIKMETPEQPFGACARCKQVKYCGVDCQKKHWKIHKKSCRPDDGNGPLSPRHAVSPMRSPARSPRPDY